MTTRSAALLLALAACSGAPPNPGGSGGGDPHGDGGHPVRGCMSDSDCGDGQVCVDCDGDGQCTPGCRDDSQCGPRDICQLGTTCQTCPCAPGWCILNPCRDDDSDGYAPVDDGTAHCTIPTGDCNDRDPTIHPGATEICTNYQDDNCDGLVDERDPNCQCPTGEARCSDSWECGDLGNVGCTKGCCQSCNAGQKPNCTFGGGEYCALPYGVNTQNGCNYGWSCYGCSGCPATVDPVCALNGSTYDNECLLQVQQTKLLHMGACLPGEGIECLGSFGLDGGCGPSGQLYCRDQCGGAASCSVGACTKKGACEIASDCEKAMDGPPPPCDAGTPAFACINGACTGICQ
jgi:hypothetical protein